jgi:hypothetical protein
MNNREPIVMTNTGKRRIRRIVFWGAWWGIALVGVVLALPAAGQDGASQIQAEVERLQQLLANKPVSFPGNPDANRGASDALKSALKEQSAGRLYLSLYQLGEVSDFIHGVWTVMDKAEAVKSGVPAFEAEWEKVSANIAALDRQARATNWSDSPAALPALSETAEAKTMPLLEGGRGFAVSTEPKDGLFNIGEAQGQAEFAAFVASLRLPRKGAAYPLRSLLPELASFQQKVNAAFRPPRSIDLHVQFMLINSALKQAEELDASRSYAGALCQYLKAVHDYGTLDAGPVETSRQPALKDALAQARSRLNASGRDESIAQLFLEWAESGLAHPDGSAPSADDWRSASVILDQVLPAYFAADHPLAAPERASGKAIEITLVRWPYT